LLAYIPLCCYCAAFLLPHLKPDAKIPDVECVPGIISCGFAGIENSGGVVGIDITAQVLEQARKAANSKDLTDVAFEAEVVLQGLS
jgi:ubiquinone/menaquinone biosynthesis C-methylase UbiE